MANVSSGSVGGCILQFCGIYILGSQFHEFTRAYFMRMADDPICVLSAESSKSSEVSGVEGELPCRNCCRGISPF